MAYLHPRDPRMIAFAAATAKDGRNAEAISENVFAWLTGNAQYSRLEAPFFPLQRSDLDVLSMKAGTCGDYSNLLVSVLRANGFDAQYAYVHRDCYGDAQDHICAALPEDGRQILIDATMPYRKWHGFDCPHREYELLSPDAFESRMQREEACWRSAAEAQGRPLLAGLWYAPWVHAERVFETDARYDEVFYLLAANDPQQPILYVYYRRCTPQESALPLMAKITDGKTLWHVSIHPRRDLWDDGQWSEGFADLTQTHRTDEWRRMRDSLEKVLPRIDRILETAGCRSVDRRR